MTATQAPTPGPLSASDVAHVRDYWSAICDSDWHLIPADIRDDLEERLVSVGLAEWRAVTDDDLEDTFAYERGIEKGRSCLDLTALGHLAFKSDESGWMPWSGGENPVPGRMVEVKIRWRGGVASEWPVESDVMRWKHGRGRDGGGDIIAFRLAPTAPVEASGSEREHGPKCWGKTSLSDEMAHCYCGSTDLRPQPSGETREAVLKGVGKVNGDGWKDTTTEGEIVFVWNAEKPTPYAAGQYPRIGNEGWSASTSQYDFTPATAKDVPTILALLSARPLALGGQQGDDRGCIEAIVREAVVAASVDVPDKFAERVAMRSEITRNATDAIVSALTTTPAADADNLIDDEWRALVGDGPDAFANPASINHDEFRTAIRGVLAALKSEGKA